MSPALAQRGDQLISCNRAKVLVEVRATDEEAMIERPVRALLAERQLRPNSRVAALACV